MGAEDTRIQLILALMGRCPALRDEIDLPFGPFVVVFLKWQHLAQAGLDQGHLFPVPFWESVQKSNTFLKVARLCVFIHSLEF
jgi:hypothetical protein